MYEKTYAERGKMILEQFLGCLKSTLSRFLESDKLPPPAFKECTDMTMK